MKNDIVDINGNKFFENDGDIKRALEWFLAFIGPAAWQKRKLAIEKKYLLSFTIQCLRGKA